MENEKEIRKEKRKEIGSRLSKAAEAFGETDFKKGLNKSKKNTENLIKGVKNIGEKGITASGEKGITASDERLKIVLGERCPLDAFSKINAYDFTYTDEALDNFAGENGIDDKEHLGVMAQELKENPVTEAVVKESNDGYLAIDTGHLTTLNTALLAELTRRVQNLEEKINYGK